MVPLYDVTEKTGGLEVIADTNNDVTQKYLLETYPQVQDFDDDWLVMQQGPFINKGMLVKASAGDMILWDSRTIHGGRVGTGDEAKEMPKSDSDEPATLARLSLTVCMAGKDKVKNDHVL